MAYTAGDQILDDEYIAFANSSSAPFGYNHFAGTGSGVYGLGQTALGLVSAGDTITASQWNSLFTAMANVANHTEDTLTSTGAVTAGDTIAIRAALIADLATLAASVAGGCVNASGGLDAATTELTTASSAAAGNPSRYNDSHVVEHSVTFSTADQARFYFNAGGKIQINVTRTGNGGSSATSKDSSVDQLITGLGDFKLASQSSSRTGSTETQTGDLAIGFYDLTADYQTICVITQDSGTYSGFMNIKIEAKADALVSGGTATVVTIKTTIEDPALGDSSHDDQYTAGNTGGVDQFANFIGVTNVVLKLVKPNTSNGLATVYAPSDTAVVSNTTTV